VADTGALTLPPQADRVLAAALEAAAVIVTVIDRTGRPAYVNGAACEIVGYSEEELRATSVVDLVAPEERAEAEQMLAGLWRGDLPSDYTLTLVAHDGRRVRVRWRFSHLADADGTVTHLVAVGIDVTRQQALGRARRAAEERFRRSFDGAPVGMSIVRAEEEERGAIVAVNRAMCRMLGLREADLVGRTVEDVTHPDDVPHERRWLAEWLDRGADQTFQYEKRLLTAKGDVIHASLRASLLSGEPGGRFILAHVVDITDRKRAQETAVGEAVEPVTGLLTEPAFLRELRATMAEDQPVSVAQLRLLPAADVQAVHGHVARDELVERGAARLGLDLPPDARLARIAPDQFGAFFKATGREALEIVKDAVARIGREPATGTLSSAPLSFAAGVAACDPGQHEPPEAVYTAARVALEDALRAGTLVVLSGRTVRERAAKRLSWQNRLRRGLHEAGFLVHGQPVCRLDTGAVAFTELSLRMRGDDGKLVFPSVFLPVAESTGLIAAIDRWLLEHVRDLLRERPGERYAIRLSAATLADPAAGDAAVALLRGESATAERLTIEMAAGDASLPQRSTAHRLAECGCRLLLLNFGMAFGSLHHARKLPLSALKIHGSFTRDIEESERDRVIIRAVAECARALGVTTIGEFVESPVVAATLRDLGVDCGQGFHFGRPGPV
jgi:PAS domain S-box-containing protein